MMSFFMFGRLRSKSLWVAALAAKRTKARAKANTGILRFAQDDDLKTRATATTTSNNDNDNDNDNGKLQTANCKLQLQTQCDLGGFQKGLGWLLRISLPPLWVMT
jgi:hypothetical protein